MQILDNINTLWGEDLKKSLKPGAKLKIAASCFSIYAYTVLKKELEKIEESEFIFTSPTFITNKVTDKISKEKREFHIPKPQLATREKNLYGSEFEIQLKNKLTQKAIAKECAAWIRRKANFRSNATKAPMQQFAYLETKKQQIAYTPIHGFTAVDLGYQKGDAVSNFIVKTDEAPASSTYLQLFDQIWNDDSKLEDVTDNLCEHIESVYQENSPEKIYYLMLFHIFNEFLDDINEDVLPNDLTGYKESVIWQKLFNFQHDAATGIINKLETYNGCILADSVGLGKTFTALAVIKYYELRNRSVLVLCPKKLADNWLNYNRNLKTNILSEDRLNYDVLCHTDLQRTSGESFGTPLDRIHWGNYDLVVIDESHNFRNNDAYKDKETRYKKLMNSVIRDGVKTKVLMLSATPVNNHFNDLRNQLALAYEGDSEKLSKNLQTSKSIEKIFRQAQTVFNQWSKLPPEERTAKAILNSLDFDFFELLDSVTIARSRRHIERFYDTTEIGRFPTRRKPLSYRCPLTERSDVLDFNEIYQELSQLKLSIYAPVNYILPSRLKKYEELYDTSVEGGRGKLRQADREKSLQSLMTTNLLKRLESSIEAFRLTMTALKENHSKMLEKIKHFKHSGMDFSFHDIADSLGKLEADDDELNELSDMMIGGKVQVSLADMDLPSWEYELQNDLNIINELLKSMVKVKPEDDSKLQHLLSQIENKIKEPINAGNKKILIFSAFADTANYLYNNLAPVLQKNHGLFTAKVTGSESPKTNLKKGFDFQSILTLFSPISKEKALILPNEPGEIDILIATDCISEGQNLQDCDYLINYDIHWNPVRIIQRFGRIDRIGSHNNSIQLVNYWPDISLDEYINLKERVENRMIIADVTATGDDNILSAKSNQKDNEGNRLIANTDSNDTILDFFSGSATTAHAAIQMNSEDGGNRKFIMVQLPELCNKKSEAYKAGYKTIPEISKERIRRAGKKIKKDNPETTSNLDIGFRVLKVDSSNMSDVYYTPDAMDQKLLGKMQDNIKPERSAEDLLFQVLLDWGLNLSLPIKKEIIAGQKVFFVDDNVLAACFVKNGEITEDFVKELATHKPLRAVFRDAGYSDSSVKINIEQIFKLISPHTEIKTL